MKYFIYNGTTTDTLPGIITLANGDQLSPVTETSFVANGGEIIEDGEPTHWELLDAACDKFVACCNKIGQFIGNPDFQGGIDEIDELRAFAATLTDPAQIMQALWLVAEWEGCDKECNHWASKDDVGLASPAWWWYCWSRYAEMNSPEEVIEAATETEPAAEEPEQTETPVEVVEEPAEEAPTKEPESPAEDPAPEVEPEAAE